METYQAQDQLFKHLIQSVQDYAIFALDPSGIIVSWNRGAERAKGYTAEEIIGKHFSIFYEEEAKKRNHPAFELEQALKHNSYEEEGWRLKKDGSRFWANVLITALFDEDGKHIGFAKVTRDLSERKKAREEQVETADALQNSEQKFDLMVAAVKDYAIFALDSSGYVITWNTGAERIKGYTAAEVIGKHFSIFYDEEAKKRNHPAFELEEALKNGSYEEEGWRVKKDGSLFWSAVTITPISGRAGGFIKVTRDLTEQKEYEIKLEKALEQALLANKLKSEFVASITHEIRTPLASIIGLAELMAGGTDIDNETRDSAAIIFDSSKLLLGLLNDLLDFSKLEAGKVNIEMLSYSLEELVGDVVGLVANRAEQKQLEFIVKITDSVPKQIIGDSNKVRQILLNLVSNAIKFTESGGIEIFVERRGDELYFSIADSGIGISAEAQEKLFQPFSQAHNSTARLYGGSGLGLSIAQQYVHLMGGEIGLFSKIGRGSTFWFVLPLRRDRAGGVK